MFSEIFFFFLLGARGSEPCSSSGQSLYSENVPAPKTAELWDHESSEVHWVSGDVVLGDGASGSMAAKLKKFEKPCSGI